MDLSTITIEPIGIAHSPFSELAGMPIQPKGAQGKIGTIEIRPEFVEGLKDLAGFSHIYLIYHFHKAGKQKLTVKPFMDNQPRGVFATRSPVRPSHIGISIVELLSVENNIITVSGIDLLDQTPILDIKPYVEKFDYPENSQSGWMQASADDISNKRADDRFA